MASLVGMRALQQTSKASIRGHALEYVMRGDGRPPIVLLNGAGGPVEAWYKVYDALAASATVFAYNRLGVGRSDKPNEPQTGRNVVTMLRELLARVGLEPPFVLVGHSLGGLYANLYARSFPNDVAGVVLVESATPSDIHTLGAHQSRLQRLVEAALSVAWGKDEYGETSHVGATAAALESAGAFPDVPLRVVTGTQQALSWLRSRQLAARLDNQRALCALSPRSRQLIAARSGHFPQFSEPEIVVQAVREVAQWNSTS